MKLAPRDAARYFARPDPAVAGLLIHGADAMRVALRRQEVIAALIGPGGADEMRLERLQGPALRRDAATLVDAVTARGFFPGPRAVFVEEAGDAIAEACRAALDAWAPGDANLVVTAGTLRPGSPLRKLFEERRDAYAAAIYDDAPGRDEVEAMLRDAGLTPGHAMDDLMALAAGIDPGELRQTIEKIALYKHGDAMPLTSGEVAACAPASQEAALDDAIDAAAEARLAALAPILRRLEAQGATPVALCIAALRHFRTLHAAAVDGGASLRQQRNFRRRERMQKQLRGWDRRRLERALATLVETDLALRSTRNAPEMPVIERALIRLAMLARG